MTQQTASERFNTLVKNLEREYLLTTYSLKTTDKRLVHVGKEFWKYSKTLLNESPEGMNIKVEASVLTVELLRKLCVTCFDANISVENFVELIALAQKLKIGHRGYTRMYECFLKSSGFETSYRKNISSKVAVKCFEALCNTAFRSEDVYRNEIGKVSAYCENAEDIMVQVLESLSKAACYASLNLSPLPIDFEVTSVPLAIIKESGLYYSQIFYNGKWEILDVLGRYFDIPDDFRAMALFYGKFMLYLNASNEVIIRRLDCDHKDDLVLTKCTFMWTKNGEVFARTKDNHVYTIHYWTCGSFVPVFESSHRINGCDYLPSKHLLGISMSQESELTISVMPIDNTTKRMEVARFDGEEAKRDQMKFEGDDVVLFTYSDENILYDVYSLRQSGKSLILAKKLSFESSGLFQCVAGFYFDRCRSKRTLKCWQSGKELTNVAWFQELSLLSSMTY